MAGSGRQTSAERRKERERAARAAAAAASRRRRLQVLAGGVAVVLVAGAVFGAVAALQSGDEAVQADPAAESSPPAEPSPEPTRPAPPGKAYCTYTPNEQQRTGDKDPKPPKELADAKGPYYATVTTNKGKIQMELDAKAAPCAVNSFVSLIKQKFYADTSCHRLLNQSPNHVLQCGDPTGTGSGGPGYRFPDENLENATYGEGIVALANSGADTNGSQFFIMFKDSLFQPSYVPFATITSGLDVVAEVAEGGTSARPGTGDMDVPKTKLTIEKVTVSQKKPKA